MELSLEYIASDRYYTLPLTLVSFGSGGIRDKYHSSRHVDLRESNHPPTTPHSTYYCDICILHVVKANRHYKTHLTYPLYSFLLLKQIIILLKYTITKSFRYSPNTQLNLLQNITGAFINLNYNTIGLNKPFLVLNAPFYLFPSLILIQ